jgi:serine/threonine-protein kinase
MIGRRLAQYEVTTLLGKGGMGEVYLARDTRLERDVAIKVLPDGLTADAGRLSRFEREARTLASLNHPNIAQIYGLEDVDGIRLLVMEHVPGEDLAARLTAGRLPVDEAIAVAAAIADGLDAAHRGGVVHRDLKPANIKVTPDGAVKILDFGLAQAFGPEASGEVDPALSPTLTHPVTAPGTILGTAAYMSPEQARGRPVDRRTDLWAFGVVLHEMLTGQRLFHGETATDTLAAVLRAEIDLAALPPETPARVHKLLTRCLQRDPALRQRDAGDARLDLLDDTWEASGDVPAPADAARRSRRWLPGPLALGLLVAGALIGAMGASWLGGTAPPAPATADWKAFRVHGPYFVDPAGLTIRADGRQVVYGQNGIEMPLMVLDLDGSEARPIRGTKGGRSPSYSPDGQHVVFFTDGGLYRTRVDGSGGRRLASVTDAISAAHWAANDTIYFTVARIGRPQTTGVQAISADGGPIRVLTRPDLDSGAVTQVLTDITRDGRYGLMSTIGIASEANYRVSRVDLHTGEVSPIEGLGGLARWSPTGHVLLSDLDRDALRAVPLDLASLDRTGEPASLLDGIGMPDVPGFGFDVSDEGTVVHGFVASNLATEATRTVERVTRDGEAQALPIPDGPLAEPRLAPDGERLILRHVSAEECDLWIHDLTSGSAVRLTFAGDDHHPVWLPDGGLVYVDRGFDRQAVMIFDEVPGPVRTLVEYPDRGAIVSDVTPDGTRLILELNGGQDAESGIFLLPITPAGAAPPEAEPWLVRREDDTAARISPDGVWIAHESRTEERREVFLRRFDDPGTVVQVSAGGGLAPFWSRDGSQLFYLGVDSLMVCDVTTEGGQLALSPPRGLAGSREGVDLPSSHEADIDGVIRVRYIDDPSLREYVTFLTGLEARLAGR